MRAARLGLGTIGVVVGLYGGYLLLSRQDLAAVGNAVVWLAAAVAVHDAVVAVVVLAAGAFTTRVVPPVARAPVAVGAVVLGVVSVVAVPMLGRFGALPDNPTLLDRPYWLGWSIIAALVVLGVVGTILLRRRRRHGGPS